MLGSDNFGLLSSSLSSVEGTLSMLMDFLMLTLRLPGCWREDLLVSVLLTLLTMGLLVIFGLTLLWTDGLCRPEGGSELMNCPH